MTRRSMAIYATTLSLLICGPLLLSLVENLPAGTPLSGTPLLSSCDQAVPSDESDQWTPTLIGADRMIHAAYRCNGIHFQLTLAQYLTPVQGEEAVSDLNVLAPDFIRYNRTEVDLGNQLRVNEHSWPSRSPMIVWNWYGVGDHALASPLAVKAVQVLDALRMLRRDSTVVVLSASTDDPQAARAAVRKMAPEIWSWLSAQRNS